MLVPVSAPCTKTAHKYTVAFKFDFDSYIVTKSNSCITLVLLSTLLPNSCVLSPVTKEDLVEG